MQLPIFQMKLKSMKKDYKYTILLFSLLPTTAYIFYLVFKKYSYDTIQHLVNNCQKFFSLVWPLNVHTIGVIALILIILVSFTFVLTLLFSYIKFNSKIGNLAKLKVKALPQEITHLSLVENDLQKIILIKSKDYLSFSYGFYKPKIYISTSLVKALDPKQLEAVILHELYHVKNNHMLLLFLNELVSTTLFFFPVLKDLVKKVKVYFENQADSFVKEVQKTDIYLHKSLKVIAPKRNGFSYTLVPSFSSEATGHRRINYSFSKIKFFQTILFSMLLWALLYIPSTALADNHMSSKSVDASICTNNQCSQRCISNTDTFENLNQSISVNLNYSPLNNVISKSY